MSQQDPTFWSEGLPKAFDPADLERVAEDPVTLIAGSTFLPGTTDADGNVEAEIFPLEDGRVALLAFSSLNSLVSCMGRAQPWVAIKSELPVERLQMMTRADVIIWDTELPPEIRRTEV
ncbi:SAV_915 family protein [Amycolatopsis thailandensis]|uniref:SAV_915 family protein n=1 Tax=Amycolatopsis thailandensis TaxID=589330 RepID=UPI00364685D4